MSRFFKGHKDEYAHLSKVDQPPEVLDKILPWLRNPSGFFLFLGSVGIGKTYLCSAICNAWEEKQEETKKIGQRWHDFYYVDENRFISQLKKTMSDNGGCVEDLIQDRCDSNPLFIYDDFASSMQMTDWKHEMLYAFIEHRYTKGLATIITSNLSVKGFKETFHPRLVSRVFDCRNIVVELHGDDRRQMKYA